MQISSAFSARRFPLLTLVAGLGLTVGFLAPVVFEWMQEPWNRTRLVGMEWAAMVSAVAACGLGVLEYWHRRRFEQAADERRPKVQFRLWQLFAVMTIAAVLLAVMKWLSVAWASSLTALVAVVVLGWGLFQEPGLQLRASALVAALFCPMMWMVAYNVPLGRTSGLVSAIPFAPGLLPAVLIRAVTYRSGPDQMGLVAAAIVIGELLLGAWLAWRGGKLFTAYLLLMLLVSSVSSFIMHALYRA